MSISSIKALLPEVHFERNDSMTAVELFNHEVLRPILKFQSKALCRLTLHYCFQLNPAYGTLSGTKKRKMLNDQLSGNQPLRNQLNGLIIGLFEAEDWTFYLQHQRDINKRIQAMVQVRILDQYEKHLPKIVAKD